MINPSTGRYFPLKYTCLGLITATTSFMSVSMQEMGAIKFGDVALIDIGLGGVKMEVKKGVALYFRRKTWGKKWAIFSPLEALYTARLPFKTFSIP